MKHPVNMTKEEWKRFYPEQMPICQHEWLQNHEEFIPHPFYYLIRCLECNRIIIDKSNPKPSHPDYQSSVTRPKKAKQDG